MLTVKKISKDPHGLEYELALFKAMYIYPKPIRLDRQGVHEHALNIYEGELLNRSLVESYPHLFAPMTYKNVEKYLPEKWFTYTERTVTKNRSRRNGDYWEDYDEVKKVPEYRYMFEDIIHIPSRSVIECKKYTSETGRARHRKRLLEKKHFIWSDFIFMAEDRPDDFIITDVLSINQNGKFRRHELNEFFNV